MTGTKKQSQHRENSFEWPEVINIKSDGSQLTFVAEKPKDKNDKELFGMYKWTVSRTLLGKVYLYSQSQVVKMVERNAS